MTDTSPPGARIPFTAASSLATGLHVSAALGGGAPHAFLLDTGSVGVLAPRSVLGPAYQEFDPALDIEFGYVSSGKTYLGQWVRVPVVLGAPPDWDGTGDYHVADVEVFAVDRPADFDGGLLGVGFAIGGLADGGRARNPLLNVTRAGERLPPAYRIGLDGIYVGRLDETGFAFVDLVRDAAGQDWRQPSGRVTLSGGFGADLPVLVDTGIAQMILWVSADAPPPGLARGTPFPSGVSVTVSAPPALDYAFVTGETRQPMAPSHVEWRVGCGVNTGRNVLAAADYLYDAGGGRVGFRACPPPELEQRVGRMGGAGRAM
jgi:hypothetical protein